MHAPMQWVGGVVLHLPECAQVPWVDVLRRTLHTGAVCRMAGAQKLISLAVPPGIHSMWVPPPTALAQGHVLQDAFNLCASACIDDNLQAFP